MLLRFGVSNHLSIREFQELSLSTSALIDAEEASIQRTAAPRGSALRAAVIYGANASGKSNFVDALETMKGMVLYSQTQGQPGGGVRRSPFRLDSASSEEPSRFEIDFVLENTRYHYGFEASDTAFESEWLYSFPKSYQRILFERDGDEFHFGRTLKGQNGVIAEMTRPNSLYLSTAAQHRHERISKIYGYFQSIHVDRNIAIPGFAASAQLVRDEPDRRVRRVIGFLEKMDMGIVGYRRKKGRIPEGNADIIRETIEAIRRHSGDRTAFEKVISKSAAFELAHRGQDGEAIYLELDRESAGTRRLLIILGLSYRALGEGAVLVIDELDASLHTRACEGVLKLFCSPETNPKGAQIVATTHDTNLMNAPLLRRDQVWLTEKDDVDATLMNAPLLRRDQVWLTEKDGVGATRLYPLTDIRTRKGDNIEKGYLQGRYGAIPVAGSY